jgi:phosphoglycerol transferase MdoB-like AlkP superfamily enzyme
MIVIIFSMRKTGRSLSKVLGHAADWTTPVLFISVYIISSTVFQNGQALYMISITLIIAIIYAVIERIHVKEFKISYFFKKLRRLIFLILSICYVLLLVIGLILKVVENTAH